MLTQKILHEILSYNPDTGVFNWKKRDRKWFKCDGMHKRWNDRFAGKVAGTIERKYGGEYQYRTMAIFGKHYKAHRIAWKYVYGRWPRRDIDHINQNPLDNSINNLRDVSRETNQRNRKIKNKHGVVGVTPEINGRRKFVTAENK